MAGVVGKALRGFGKALKGKSKSPKRRKLVVKIK